MASASSNPSGCEQKYGNIGKILEELPNPGPIPPKLSEDVPKEEEPSVEKDICRGAEWVTRKPRTSKPKRRAYNCTPSQAAQTLVDIKNSKSNLLRSLEFLKEPNIGKPQFAFQKKLTHSDIRTNRLVLPKGEAKKHFPLLCHEEETIVMKDFVTSQSWEFKYRSWKLQNKTMHILKQTGEFTKAHELQKGHVVRFYTTPQGDYVIQGIRMCLGSKRPDAIT